MFVRHLGHTLRAQQNSGYTHTYRRSKIQVWNTYIQKYIQGSYIQFSCGGLHSRGPSFCLLTLTNTFTSDRQFECESRKEVWMKVLKKRKFSRVAVSLFVHFSRLPWVVKNCRLGFAFSFLSKP